MFDVYSILFKLTPDEEKINLFGPYLYRAEESFPHGKFFFLENDFIAKYRRFAGLDESIEKVLIKLSGQIKDNAAQTHFIWLCYFLTCKCPDYPSINFRNWPTLEKLFGEEYCDAVFILIALAGIPMTQGINNARNIPNEITEQTCRDIKVHAETFFNNKNKIGITTQSLSWFRNWMLGKIYQIGRFQYKIEPFSNFVEVYRNKCSGEIIALATEGLEFNSEGFYPIEDDYFNEATEWTSHIIYKNNSIKGYPVSPYGMAKRKEIILDKRIWECVLSNGDMVLDMHIPAGGGMYLDACQKSMTMAIAFFEKYFNQTNIAGFQCLSWILNPKFEQILNKESNLVKFQRELYLYPITSSGLSGVDRVFGSFSIDISTAPRDSSLQRAILDQISQKNPLRNGGMFFLKENLNNFGSSFYRKNWRDG